MTSRKKGFWDYLPHVSAKESGYTSLSKLFKVAWSGGAQGRYFMVMTEYLDSLMDESSDQTQKDVLCVAAFLAHEKVWKDLERSWVERLRSPDEVKYFRASDCKAVQGAFKHLRKKYGSLDTARKVADQIRQDLEHILLASSRWCGFMLAVVIPDYETIVLDEYPLESQQFYEKDPTLAAYSQLMYEVARTVRRKAKGFGVAYIVDQSHDSTKILDAFRSMKEKNHRIVGTSVKTCAPFDDKETPALQMADLLASVSKDIFQQWLTRGGPHPELGKWYNHIARISKWDRNHMLKSLYKNLTSPRFLKGTIARRPIPEHKITKGERKQMRRALVDHLQRREKVIAMGKRNLTRDALGQHEDWYGNNAAVCCPVCGQVFIVSAFISKGQRQCPKCGKSNAKITPDQVTIEWPEGEQSKPLGIPIRG